MSRDGAAEGFAQTERELRAEKAAALARIAGTLEDLLAELTRLEEQWRGGAPVAAAHRAVRERARQYRWYLEVQREALGLSRHDELDRYYPIPPPLPAVTPR